MTISRGWLIPIATDDLPPGDLLSHAESFTAPWLTQEGAHELIAWSRLPGRRDSSTMALLFISGAAQYKRERLLEPSLPDVTSHELQSLAPSTSPWVTRIVRGQPWVAESRTQYVSPSKEIHDTVGADPSGPATAKGLDRLFGLTR